MSLKPICVPCERFYRMKQSGYYFLEGKPTHEWKNERGRGAAGWEPYKVWVGDLWECPTCKHQLVSGVGQNRLAEHYEPDFSEVVERTGAVRFLVKDC